MDLREEKLIDQSPQSESGQENKNSPEAVEQRFQESVMEIKARVLDLEKHLNTHDLVTDDLIKNTQEFIDNKIGQLVTLSQEYKKLTNSDHLIVWSHDVRTIISSIFSTLGLMEASPEPSEVRGILITAVEEAKTFFADQNFNQK